MSLFLSRASLPRLAGVPAVALVGTLLTALACDNPQPLAPSVSHEPLIAQFAQAPADGNGSKQILALDFTFPVDCGAETITGHALGWIQIRTFGRPDTRNVEVLVVNLLFTMTNSAGATFVWREVGIDHFTIDQDGALLRAVIGRGGGEFGIIGRLVINQDTGLLEFVAGNDVGNAFVNACAELT
jgi:hypothetical protein